MKVLYVMWDSFATNDIVEELLNKGYEVDSYWLNRKLDTYDNRIIEQELIQKLSQSEYSFVYSYNFFPVVSIACNVCKVKYASWIYDSPLASLWHCSVVSPYNFIFVFDKTDYWELKSKGIDTVYYLPLAANVRRMDSYVGDKEIEEVYTVPISFVGSLYSENRFSSYKEISKLNDYNKGYVDGLVQAQKKVYGSLLLEKLLPEEITQQLQEVSKVIKRDNTYIGFEKYFGQVVLPRCITSMEREEILEMLSERYKMYLYTIKKTPFLPKIINRGIAGSKKESAFIFRYSKINLNMTLRSIRSGIPLRAFEIIGSGGFLLTNYQEDYLDCFEPGIDYVYYESYEDLLEKVEYYLSHESERAQIAKNGYEKVKKYHTYKNRVETMLETMGFDV